MSRVMGRHYGVHELFSSIQGEGLHAGRAALFIRLQGCPVGCSWCDAKRTWYAGGTRMSADEIVSWVMATDPSGLRLIIITGGEPLIYDLDPLLRTFGRMRRRTLIETSGAKPLLGIETPDYLVASPKAAANWHVDPRVYLLASEVKFVVDDDFCEENILAVDERLLSPRAAGGMVFPHGLTVSLMPEGAPPRPEMVEKTLAMIDRYPHLRFSPRLQYAYPAIASREGDTNAIISQEQARAEARAHVRS